MMGWRPKPIDATPGTEPNESVQVLEKPKGLRGVGFLAAILIIISHANSLGDVLAMTLDTAQGCLIQTPLSCGLAIFLRGLQQDARMRYFRRADIPRAGRGGGATAT